MNSPPLPGDRITFRRLLPVPLLTAVPAALAVAAAVVLGPESARGAVAVTGAAAGLLLCAAVTVAARAVLSARTARTRLEAVTEDLGRLRREGARLAEEHAAETARLADGHAAETARLTEEHATRVAQLEARLREADGARAAALSATANAAGRMQALATGMLADLRAMEEKHHDEEVLTDLLHLDHRTAQAGRLADSIAVLTGARSGRRWARPIAMESILRGAMGRISGYRRIRVHHASDAAVAGHAAEGVMHALAELLDNAANFSPPTAEVHVYVEDVPSGVLLSVEDSGLVMGEVQLRRAERAVSGESTELGGLTGTRLGLAVVGRLARRYGLKISYRPSARGGTGVLMLVPQKILVPQDAPPSAGTAPDRGAAPTTASARSAAPATGSAAPATAPIPAPPGAGTPPTGTPAPAGAPAASGTSGTTPSATGTPAADGTPAAPETPAAGGNPAPGEPAAPVLPRRRSGRAKAGPAPAAGGTQPETGHRTTGDTAPGTPDRTTPAVPAPTRPAAPSAVGSRATAGPGSGPVPTHESPDPAPDTDAAADPLVLPRRRRGRTLAEAERGRSGSRAAAPRRPAPTAEETRARTARLSSFRQAVRSTGKDTASAAGPASTPPSHPTNPEGDTTS
ncbi:ATP-binding protein [Streptomyces griseoloalbus]|uniref:histidine kinase n=1 Tax=Streptomyces griseoloalbus TaxID=67303 RepID=A0ABV3E3G6_9ACTN